ncbi:MAG: GNAT family N-acetyltransferase [SAR324 cluster bacterium]|nr:GNAT family N-acetyltransferase [SAR324 cluster bacterium]
MKEIVFTVATPQDRIPIEQLLSNAKLPFTDLITHLPHFVVGRKNNEVIGVIGLEILGEIALLRSLAVTGSYQGKGLSQILYEKILDHAKLQQVKTLYVLTTTAEDYFDKRGFLKIQRSEAPESIKATKQFSGLCPASAVCLVKDIQ